MHDKVHETTGKLLGRRDRNNDATHTTWMEGSDVNITHEQRINNKAPVSEQLHMCKIGDRDRKTVGLWTSSARSNTDTFPIERWNNALTNGNSYTRSA